MALTPEQRRNAQILRSATNRPIIAKAILEAGLVESGLRHLSYGDRDSVGILQQRPSMGWGPAGESVAKDASQFVRAANRVLRGGFRGSAAQLAQKVQRSGFPERYGQRAGEAEGLLRSLVGPSGGSSGGSTPVTLTAQVPTTDNSFDPGQGSDLSALAGLLQQPPVPPPVQAPQAPNSSQRYLSSAGTSPVVAPPAPQQDNLGALLAAIQSPGEGLPEVSRGSESVSVSGSVPNARAASTGAQAASGRYPLARHGQVIGTPHTGTHTLGDWQSDRAYDIAVPAGTPMVALQDGVIVKVRHHPQGAGRFAGDQITVRGANGNEYFYAHGVASVKAGQRVRKGQRLGVSGSANGVNHLHFAQKRGNPGMHLGRQ